MRFFTLLLLCMNSLFASQNISVLIVGAGPSGLTAAKALQNSAIYPDIIEKEVFIRSEGAGIAIPANGSWALQKIGIAIEKHARKIEKMQFTDDRGELLIEEEISNIHADGAQFYSISREGLQKMLLSSLDSKTSIALGKEITAIAEEQGKLLVHFSDKSYKTYDFVIGCDGIHSNLRRHAHPDEKPEYLGLLVWRTMTDAPADLTSPVYMLGKDRTALLYPLPDNKMYVYGQIFQETMEKLSATYGELFGSFGGKMAEVIHKLSDSFYIHHMEKSHSVRYRLDGFSRILLIGDAAHAFGPMLQNGAAQAFEDAFVLQDMCKNGVQPEEVPNLINSFIARREARVQKIFTTSNVKIQALSDPKIVEGRNETIRKMGAPNVNAFKQFMKENP